MVIGGETQSPFVTWISPPAASTEPPMVIGGEVDEKIVRQWRSGELQRSRRW